MNNFIKATAALTLSLLLFGCAGSPGGNGGVSALSQTNVIIDGNKNFKYVQQGVTGKGASFYLFGIGGMATSDGIIGEAKDNLLEKYKLQPNQAMVNVTYDRQVINVLGIAVKVKFIITADIIEFID